MSRPSDPASPSPANAALVGALFFGSGAAGLVYQVLWMRSLGLLFGSDLYGVSIILGTFMGGLALGSLLGGRFAERPLRPLLFYGFAELGIGHVALRFDALLAALEPVLYAAYGGGEGGGRLANQALRIGLAGAALLVPTGVSGLAIILRRLIGTPVGLTMLLLNLPMLALGYARLGRFRFLVRTAFVVLLYNLGVDVLARWTPAGGLTQDLLLNALFGGVVGGIGTGLVFRGRGTSAGTGVVSRIVQLFGVREKAVVRLKSRFG